MWSNIILAEFIQHIEKYNMYKRIASHPNHDDVDDDDDWHLWKSFDEIQNLGD